MISSTETRTEPASSTPVSDACSIELSHRDTQALTAALATRIAHDLVRAAARRGELREGYPVTISARSLWRAMAPYISMN